MNVISFSFTLQIVTAGICYRRCHWSESLLWQIVKLSKSLGYQTVIHARHFCCPWQPCVKIETALKRMGWDLNPRDAFTSAGFQDRCIQPLCHPSGFRGCIVRRVLAEVYRACRPGRRTVAAGKPPPPASGRGGFDCFPRIF